LLNGSKPLARFKKFIPPQHAPSLIRALRPALKDQSIPFPEETIIESPANNRYFVRQTTFPRTLDRLAAGAHAYLKTAFRIAVVDPQPPGLHRRRAAGEVARLPVENPFTAEVRLQMRVPKGTAKEFRLPVYPLKWWTGRFDLLDYGLLASPRYVDHQEPTTLTDLLISSNYFRSEPPPPGRRLRWRRARRELEHTCSGHRAIGGDDRLPFDNRPALPAFMRNVNYLPAPRGTFRQKLLFQSVESSGQWPNHRCPSRPRCRTCTSDRPLGSSSSSSSYVRPSASARRLSRSRSSATKGDFALARGINLRSSRPRRL
jgi:hypothetical protein